MIEYVGEVFPLATKELNHGTSRVLEQRASRSEFAHAEAEGELALQMYRRSDYAFVPPLVYPALAAARAARGDVDGANAALDDWATVGGRGLAPYRL